MTAASAGHPELAISNAIGSIAAQTAFLAVADLFHRRANLEHAAASIENLMQGALLIMLLAIPILSSAAPEIAPLGLHPASPTLVIAYLLGLRLVKRARAAPLWFPAATPETRRDVPDERSARPGELLRLWLVFVLLATILALSGYLVAHAGIALVARLGVSETVVGGLFTAVSTSIPELVTSIAAVRQGALTMAVSGVIGGNCFDVLFLAFADAAYRSGSIYHAMTERQLFIFALTLLLTGILLLGLLRREKSGIANIGFESFLILVLYLGAFALLAWAG